MVWMDEWTEEQIGFARMKNAVRPQSVYGGLEKLVRRPFCPGDEAVWQADHEDALRLSEAIESRAEIPALEKALVNGLKGLPDVRGAVSLLLRHGALTLEQVAALKRLCVKVANIEQSLQQAGVAFSWWQFGAARAVATKFAQADGLLDPGFSLSDLGDEAYGRAFRAWEQAKTERLGAERDFLRELATAYGVAWRRDQTLILGSGDEAKVRRAEADARLRLRLRTAFDVVFDPVWPEAVRVHYEEERAQAEALGNEQVRLLRDLSVVLHPDATTLNGVLASIGHFDELLARVLLAQTAGYTWPTLAANIEVQGGRQPGMKDWVPVDVSFHARLAVLTGPNMGGKSAAQKTWLLLQAAHQLGYPVPADKYAAPLFAAIRYVGGDAQSLTGGLSSFGAEMAMLKATLALADAMVAYDEIGRHTNPEEGEALVRALLEALLAKPAGQYILATHFRLPAASGIQYLRVAGIRAAAPPAAEGNAVPPSSLLEWLHAAMDYRILEARDGDVPKQGLLVAKWLGVPEALIKRAEQLLGGTSHGGE